MRKYPAVFNVLKANLEHDILTLEDLNLLIPHIEYFGSVWDYISTQVHDWPPFSTFRGRSSNRDPTFPVYLANFPEAERNHYLMLVRKFPALSDILSINFHFTSFNPHLSSGMAAKYMEKLVDPLQTMISEIQSLLTRQTLSSDGFLRSILEFSVRVLNGFLQKLVSILPPPPQTVGTPIGSFFPLHILYPIPPPFNRER